MSNCWLDPLSTSILHVCEQRRLWRDCTDAQARLSHRPGGGGGGGNSLYCVWYRRAAGIAPIFQVIHTSIDHNFILYIIALQLVPSCAKSDHSLQVILLLSVRNQSIIHYLIKLMIFPNETNPSKRQQGTLLVIFYNGIYIYRYTLTILQYTFIGWVCGGPAAHLYQVYVRDTPPPRGHRWSPL